MQWFDPKPPTGKRAVAYYRHSAQDKQEYSVEIQQEHVRKFAADNGIEIIKEFADRGITGVVVKDRDAFNEMIQVYVEGGKEKFDYVLVFDVSRWGRFQDGDESAHYTWLCSSRGIKVIFSTMGFQKENDLFYGVYLNFERWRAARYSQELSEKVWKGCSKIASYGYWAGGMAPYGMRRLLLDEQKKPVRVLELGEHKAIHNQRTTLTPGDDGEVETIREIFRFFVNRRRPPDAIAAMLNGRQIPSPGKSAWTRSAVCAILRNEIYAGTMVWNKTSQKLNTRIIHNVPANWVRTEDAFEPIVPKPLSPILCLTSPTKRGGKTTLLHLVGSLVPRPLFAANITPAAIYRTIERHVPSLLVDEADTFISGNEELRGILNSGHLRSAAIVVRTTRGDFEPRTYRTWCPKVVALIGRLSDTIEDRAIMIPLKRCVSGEKPERPRFDSLDQLVPPQRRACRWAKDNVARIRHADPCMPVELGDRAADNWRHLLAIADLAGGDWPRRARIAAVAPSDSLVDHEENICELLLRDIRDLFEKRRTSRMFSEEIVLALADMYDRPWPEFAHGKAITKAKLARLLRPFGIHTMTFRIGRDLRKGYSADSFRDAFSRYAPSTSVTPLQNIHVDIGTQA